MNREEFVKEVRKLNDTRVHKVTGSLGSYDAFKYIRKNKWYDIPRPLKEGEFYRIIRRVNDYLAKELIKGNQIKLPHRLGTLEIRKKPSRISIVDGKLITNLPIDWNATLKLWYEDKEAFDDKILVRVENEEIFKVYYNKKDANYNNQSFYEFKPNREIQRSLTKQIREGNLDAYLLKKYD